MSERAANNLISVCWAILTVIVLSFCFYSTGAWFADTDSATAIVRMGNPVYISVEGTLNTTDSVVPGDSVTFGKVVVKRDANTSAMYVRAKIDWESEIGASAITAPENISGWVKSGSWWYYAENLDDVSGLSVLNSQTDFDLGTLLVDKSNTHITLVPLSKVYISVRFEAMQTANRELEDLVIEDSWCA